MADLLFDWFRFDQAIKSVNSFYMTKGLNPNKSNRRSAAQWYFPLQSKWVFSGGFIFILIFKNDLWSDRTHQLTICLTDFNKQHCYAKIINRFAYLVESKLVKQEVSHTVMLILLKWVISLHK